MFIVINPTGVSKLSVSKVLAPRFVVILVEPDVTEPISIFAVPSKDTPFIFLAVSNAVAVAAFPVVEPDEPEVLPVTLPVKLPSTFATSVPVVIVKSPVEAPVKVPVPTINLSALSSKPINALLELPLSITIPTSPEGVPVAPFASSSSLSLITVFVDDTVVVVPFTVKFPAIVTLFGNPIVNVSPLTDVSTSFEVP